MYFVYNLGIFLLNLSLDVQEGYLVYRVPLLSFCNVSFVQIQDQNNIDLPEKWENLANFSSFLEKVL